jgi:2'-5' RNA ligase
MSSVELYDNIFSQNMDFIRSGNVQIDEVLSTGREDHRLGVSLIIPVKAIGHSYIDLIHAFRMIEPYQYYYPFSDLHITIFDFIHGNDGYKVDFPIEKSYVDLTKKALRGIMSFEIEFRGIVFSREAGIIKGYDNNQLVEIRKIIRELLKAYGMKNDERYESESAHITFCRFKNPLMNPERFIATVKNNISYEIGVEQIDAIELVEHDWYNKKSKKRVIESIKLP